jgi:hypothetical protein
MRTDLARRTLRSVICLVSAGIGLCAAPLAGAVNATASASMTDLTFQVIDLTPNDGMAAGFTFEQAQNGAAGDLRVSSRVVDHTTGQSDHDDLRLLSGLLTPASVNNSTGAVVSSVDAGPAGFFASGSSTAEISNFASETTFMTGVERVPGDLFSYDPFTWTVLPYTQLVISASAVTSASVDTDCGVRPVNSCKSSFAAVSLRGGFLASELPFSMVSSSAGAGFPTFSDSDSGLLTLTFVNDTADPMLAYWRFEVQALGQIALTPVPEPSTYALLLAGLAGLVWRARASRRR